MLQDCCGKSVNLSCFSGGRNFAVLDRVNGKYVWWFSFTGASARLTISAAKFDIWYFPKAKLTSTVVENS